MIDSTIFIVAAGSGGHILPALHIAEHYKKENSQCKVMFFTGTTALEKKIVEKQPAVSQTIHWSLGKFSLRRWWAIPFILLQACALMCKSIFYLMWHRPEKVVSTGGLLSVPLCMVAGVMGKDVEVYELNVIPGKAAKFLFPFATKIYHVFEQTRAHCRWSVINFASKCQLAPYPLRFREHDKHCDKNDVMARINTTLTQRNLSNHFQSTRKTLFVLGGSQGSRLLNTLIKNFLHLNQKYNGQLQIIHQIGSFEERSWEQWYEQQGIPALTFSYDSNIGSYYALADVIVCRAGAGTLFEIEFFGKHCIVVPLVASTTDHQVYNAHAMAQRSPNLFTVLEQDAVVHNQNLFFDAIIKSLQL